MLLTYLPLGVLIAVALIPFLGIIATRDIPAKAAVHMKPLGEAECLPRFRFDAALACSEWRVA
jgi:hypothetical protein